MMRAYLGFKAFDPHELLCHFVARRAGLYARHGVEVTLVDTTFLPDDKLPGDTLHAACGAALAAWLQGAPYRVVLAAVDRPMFWLHAAPGFADVAALSGKRIAGYPAIAPPAQFLRLVLERAGLDAARDVISYPVRDDTARLGLLRAGDVEAAVLSSSIAPAALHREGFATAAFFGDALRVPTTGLAVREELLERRPELVGALVKAHASALEIIHRDDDALGEVLARDFDFCAEDLEPMRDLARACFTRDGRSPNEITSAAVATVARLAGVPEPPSPESLYHFSLLG